MRVKFSPKNIFLLIALLLTAVVCFFAYLYSKNQFQIYVTETYVDNTHSYVNNLALEYFDFSKSNTLKSTGDPAGYIESIQRNDNVTAVKLTDANGMIIASTNNAEVNLTLRDDANWEEALSGQSHIKNLNQDNGTATIYVHLMSSSNAVRGVVIMDTSLPKDFLAVHQFTNAVLYIVFGSLLSFALIAYFAMYELETKMEAKERSIFDQSRAQTEEKQLYEAITTSIAEALIVINKDKQIIMLNPEAEKLIGKRNSAVEYRSYEKIICFYDEAGRKIKKDPISEGLKRGDVIHISSKDCFHVKDKFGVLTPVSVNIAPVAEGKSFVKGVAMTIIDISTEKELQKIKDEFVYVVAHELGNPIFALDGYLSLLKNYSKSFNKEGKEILESSIEINRQLSSLVNDLLEVARNETGRLTFDLEKINMANILNETVKNSDFKAKGKKITIEFKKDKVPLVTGNERKIKEVCTNLIDNAIKYTPAGGKVIVELFAHDQKVITSVQDNGIGLSDDSQKHLFEKFFRAKDKASEGISGTGLGLFIAKQIVEKCGGKIWATSEEGKGSTFNFSLKIAK